MYTSVFDARDHLYVIFFYTDAVNTTLRCLVFAYCNISLKSVFHTLLVNIGFRCTEISHMVCLCHMSLGINFNLLQDLV